MRVLNVDYAELMENEVVAARLKSAVALAVSLEAGVEQKQVIVLLLEGSLLVEAHVPVASGMTAEEQLSVFSPPSTIQESVALYVSAVEGISDVSDGPIVVEQVTIAAPAGVETTDSGWLAADAAAGLSSAGAVEGSWWAQRAAVALWLAALLHLLAAWWARPGRARRPRPPPEKRAAWEAGGAEATSAPPAGPAREHAGAAAPAAAWAGARTPAAAGLVRCVLEAAVESAVFAEIGACGARADGKQALVGARSSHTVLPEGEEEASAALDFEAALDGLRCALKGGTPRVWRGVAWRLLKAAHPALRLTLESPSQSRRCRVLLFLAGAAGPPAWSAPLVAALWAGTASDSPLGDAVRVAAVAAVSRACGATVLASLRWLGARCGGASLLLALCSAHLAICAGVLLPFLALAGELESDRWLACLAVHLAASWLVLPAARVALLALALRLALGPNGLLEAREPPAPRAPAPPPRPALRDAASEETPAPSPKPPPMEPSCDGICPGLSASQPPEGVGALETGSTGGSDAVETESTGRSDSLATGSSEHPSLDGSSEEASRSSRGKAAEIRDTCSTECEDGPRSSPRSSAASTQVVEAPSLLVDEARVRTLRVAGVASAATSAALEGLVLRAAAVTDGRRMASEVLSSEVLGADHSESSEVLGTEHSEAPGSARGSPLSPASAAQAESGFGSEAMCSEHSPHMKVTVRFGPHTTAGPRPPLIE